MRAALLQGCVLFAGFAGQPQELLPAVWQLTMVQGLGLPASWFCSAVNNVLVSQCIVTPGVISDSAAAVLNLILAFVFLRGGMGFIGVAWAAYM